MPAKDFSFCEKRCKGSALAVLIIYPTCNITCAAQAREDRECDSWDPQMSFQILAASAGRARSPRDVHLATAAQ